MGADEIYKASMVPAPRTNPASGPRRYWKAVVKCSETRSYTEWHSAECAAPLSDCKGCEP